MVMRLMWLRRKEGKYLLTSCISSEVHKTEILKAVERTNVDHCEINSDSTDTRSTDRHTYIHIPCRVDVYRIGISVADSQQDAD